MSKVYCRRCRQGCTPAVRGIGSWRRHEDSVRFAGSRPRAEEANMPPPVIADTLVNASPLAVTVTTQQVRIYSLRNAITGSTRDARRAGTKEARTATARRIRDAAVTVGR